MISIAAGQAESFDPSNAVPSSNAFSSLRTAGKTHDYTEKQCGVDYFFEISSLNAKVYMTGQGKGIKPNDYIMLQLDSTPQRYQIEMIEYYGHPSDVWIALLKAIA